MKVVIDIPADLKKMLFDDEVFDIVHSYRLAMCVKKGTPLPEGATNGEVVEKIFDKSIYYILIRMMYSSCCEKLKKWWYAPYKGNLSEKPTGSESEDK